MRVTFEQVQIKATRRWVEWVDGKSKKRQETRTFMQTLNPFNKNAAGEVKSRAEIESELLAERKAWLANGVGA